jgi:hypothetical protein
MKSKVIIFAGLVSISAGVMADHNSPMGEGWANMPNDVHNTRVETRESGDNEAFKELVKYGNGASTINRFSTAEEAEVSNTNKASSGKSERRSGKKRS